MKYYFLILSFIHMTKCDVEPRIIDGEEASIKQFPHSVFLRIANHPLLWGTSLCGASIIHQRMLLTAAHCLMHSNKESNISVFVGDANKWKGLQSSIHSFFVHTKFKRQTVLNDIALVRLKTDLKFNERVKRVALMKNPPYNEKAQVAGWGLLANNVSTDQLYFIDQYVWERELCNKREPLLTDGKFCASSRNSSAVERGDSGSALIVRGYIQIGLVSYKIPSVSKSLVVYTDTGYYYDWIRKTSRKLYCYVP
ncbi:hypothetical protein PYW08_000766 [Mythimna loreyi]|uniref:Uncharacterized protein n=1 Tax=Mythimna loreyi TaxID=667449 RepID=A0ACC2QYF6_9NEOP|nr:hypothetical protein PYW08_000766 [Mythimna loreyi]